MGFTSVIIWYSLPSLKQPLFLISDGFIIPPMDPPRAAPYPSGRFESGACPIPADGHRREHSSYIAAAELSRRCGQMRMQVCRGLCRVDLLSALQAGSIPAVRTTPLMPWRRESSFERCDGSGHPPQLHADVVQRQDASLPSWERGFDSRHPLHDRKRPGRQLNAARPERNSGGSQIGRTKGLRAAADGCAAPLHRSIFYGKLAELADCTGLLNRRG